MTTTSRVKVDTAAFRRAGVTKAKEMRAALDDAVLYLAASARKRLVEAASSVFDRPTAFTLAAFGYRLLKRDAPTALVYVLPLQARYLGLQVYGGEREPGDYATTSRGIIVPGRDAVLDAYGNLPRTQVADALRNGGRWVPTANGAEVLLLPGRDRPRIVAAAEDVAAFKPRLPFYDIVEQTILQRGPGALDYVLRR